MKYSTLTLLVSSAYAKKNLRYIDPESPCRTNNGNHGPENVREPLVPVEALPEQFIWNDVKGTNYLTNIRN
jgi:hypothetical protein